VKATLEQLKKIHPQLTQRASIHQNRVIELWNGFHTLFRGEKSIARARRVLAEKLGRRLERFEYAHHKNGNTLDDRRLNLELMIAARHNYFHHHGKKLSPKTCRKISEYQLGKKRSSETRRKMSEWQIGKKLSSEHRRKLSEAQKKRFKSPEACQKISERQIGRKLSPETRRKISESNQKFWQERKCSYQYNE